MMQTDNERGRLEESEAKMENAIGQIILARLKELEKTQAWLAEKAGVSNTAVTKWLKSGKISRNSAIKVAIALNISADLLLGIDDRSKKDVYKEQLVYFFAGMSIQHKEIVLQLANQLYSLDHPNDRR